MNKGENHWKRTQRKKDQEAYKKWRAEQAQKPVRIIFTKGDKK